MCDLLNIAAACLVAGVSFTAGIVIGAVVMMGAQRRVAEIERDEPPMGIGA